MKKIFEVEGDDLSLKDFAGWIQTLLSNMGCKTKVTELPQEIIPFTRYGLPKPKTEIKKLTDHGKGKPIKGYNLKRAELDIIDITTKVNILVDHINKEEK